MYRCKIDSSYECNGCMWCYDDGNDSEVESPEEDDEDE